MPACNLQDIRVYPIKSSAGISLSTSWVDNIGLPFDRRFVVSNPQGQFITARTQPTLCLIQCNITASGLVLSAPDMPILTIDYQQCTEQYQDVTVWRDTILAQRCHQKVDQWFSAYLNMPCHLLFFGERSKRKVNKSNNPLAFADGYPLLLISEASLRDLNSQLEQSVSMSHFRPNLIIEHCEPFAEDEWKHIRIGEVEFELTKPCSRCIFTTVDPRTGEKHALQEPLTTLKSYRQVDSGDVMFGQNLIPLNKGQVKKGDAVIVLETGSAPHFKPRGRQKHRPTLAAASQIKPEQNTSMVPISLTCHKIIEETHDVKTFILTSPDEQHFYYLAGQHLPITLDIHGDMVNAVYTLSSSPTRPHYLSLTVKRVLGGRVSNFLHDHFKQGDSLQARVPNGDFHLGAIDASKLLLISAGSGITPMLSILKSLTDQAINNDVVFFHSARTEQDLIARDEISALAKQHGKCQVSYTLTRGCKPNWQDHQGHITEQMLANIPLLTEREVMVCGPEQFREAVKNLLLSLDLPQEQFHFESFGQKVPKETKTPTAKKINILFDSWNKHIKGNNQETLLEQGESAGLILPYSCRSGMCGSCKVKLESGEVNQLSNDGLTDDEKAQSYVLACSCIPTSDIVLSKG
ncbi:hybrid-cluster NAD(P)-dependent oxidoreductase [Thalassotalea atypica]|uniref:hybrid-cluster NAD(P)-dependent oxidoreductase n=1 Tax=Thalassotalea atypica TaxID=2054316 RepID=UPI0025738A95|nr:hybrid-cluster NAD(P)-dependent oxidoreductase [Thalassotalea atypica]